MNRLSGRPESNAGIRCVDTGDFAADYARSLSFESVWQRGPLALTYEQILTRASAPANGDPENSGRYLMVSRIVTGETRTYSRSPGYVGGRLDSFYLAFTWRSSQQWKAGIGYGDVDLDRDGLRGSTRMLLLRLQWAY